MLVWTVRETGHAFPYLRVSAARNFDGLPKAAELASLGPVATSPSTHRTTRV